MSQPTKGSMGAELHTRTMKAFLDMLEPYPVLSKENEIVMFEGKPLMRRPTAAEMKVISEWLAQHGIDEELTEDCDTTKLAEKLRKFDDSPLYIPERDEEIVAPRAC